MVSSVRPISALLFLACAALFVSCARSVPQGLPCDTETPPDSPIGHASNLTGDRESSTETYCLRVDETMTGIEVRIAVSITEGKVRWTLRDPAGERRWTDEVSGINMTQSTDQFEAVAGTWQLEVVASEMKGGYNLTWTATP
jgi:hypothetical protein